jgi:hypothetical protein
VTSFCPIFMSHSPVLHCTVILYMTIYLCGMNSVVFLQHTLITNFTDCAHIYCILQQFIIWKGSNTLIQMLAADVYMIRYQNIFNFVATFQLRFITLYTQHSNKIWPVLNLNSRYARSWEACSWICICEHFHWSVCFEICMTWKEKFRVWSSRLRHCVVL